MLNNILFAIMMIPLSLSIYNRINGIEYTVIETKIHEPIKPWIEWEKHQYIWEEQEEFGAAFQLARAFLGSNDIFTWNGKEYTTLYREE